ncbi:MAG: hypothetical protein KXJ53_09740 [Phenylobacterium sp.]|jgi:hypothetical protein|nr:hypothetical protein [Phenylobacterium sp.]
MCLSAPVSFAAAAILIPAGAGTVWTALRRDRRYAALAALPALFGLQQLMEGIVWITGAHGPPGASESFSLAYMFFAWIAWPVWVPVSVYFIEPYRRRSAYLVFAVVGGMLGSIQYLPYFAHEGWLSVTLLENAVVYRDEELLDAIIGRPQTYLLYVTVLIVPLVMSSDRDVRVFGGLVAAVLAVTVGFFQWAYISVFCFGGAVASLYLIWALRRKGPPRGQRVGAPA